MVLFGDVVLTSKYFLRNCTEIPLDFLNNNKALMGMAAQN